MSGASVVPPNKLGRRQHELLVGLGYTPEGLGGGGHYRYTAAGHPDVIVSGTSYDGSAWRSFVSAMRRRHPGHPLLTERRSDRASGPGTVEPYRVILAEAERLGLGLTPNRARLLLNRKGSVRAARVFLREVARVAGGGEAGP